MAERQTDRRRRQTEAVREADRWRRQTDEGREADRQMEETNRKTSRCIEKLTFILRIKVGRFGRPWIDKSGRSINR